MYRYGAYWINRRKLNGRHEITVRITFGVKSVWIIVLQMLLDVSRSR